jgi:hypothetical protein
MCMKAKKGKRKLKIKCIKEGYPSRKGKLGEKLEDLNIFRGCEIHFFLLLTPFCRYFPLLRPPFHQYFPQLHTPFCQQFPLLLTPFCRYF